MNYGLDLQKEDADRKSTDWEHRLGGTMAQCLVEIPDYVREEFLPRGEVQRSDKEDMMDCATRAPINILETKFNYAYTHSLFSQENIEWLIDNGYVNGNGHIEFSDAFTAILSGTTRNGNSLIAPLDAIHTHGLVPKHKLPLLKSMTWEEYHDPSRITESLRTLGKEFARRFTINYVRVYSEAFGDVLAHDFIDTGSYAWSQPNENGIYPHIHAEPNHAWVAVRNPLFIAFDNYIDHYDGDFIKHLAPDYETLSYGYRVYISKESTVAPENELQALVDKLLTALLRFWRMLVG